MRFASGRGGRFPMKRTHDGILQFQLRRAIESKSLPYVLVALTLLVTICFVQS